MIMHKTNIPWADYSWNPVWGCRNTCPYCYARKVAKRFGESFEPHWREKNFNRTTPKEPSVIFVNSMSDIAFWRDEWMRRVISRIENEAGHLFLFLTKIPHAYERLDGWAPHNCWFGVTATSHRDLEYIAASPYVDIVSRDGERRSFISLEPILEPPAKHDLFCVFDWLIVGAETGNREDRVIPAYSWRNRMIEIAKDCGTPLFMKDNIVDAWGEPLIREYPNHQVWDERSDTRR